VRRLSVVMAVRDGEEHLGAALESVLAQSVNDFEFLIVDDASTDETGSILREYQRRDSRIRVLRNRKNLGPYASVNRALMDAVGACVARHDADDISPPDRFAVQMDAFGSGHDISLVTGAVEVFDGSRRVNHVRRPPRWQPRLEWDLLFSNAVGAGSHVLFPRLIRGMPVLFPTRHRYAEDYWLWCHLSRLGAVVCPESIVYRHRVHPGSISSRNRTQQSKCASRIRREYQSSYLDPDVTSDAIVELSRFWTRDGRRPLGANIREILAMLASLRNRFLDYVLERYGLPAMKVLDAEIDEAMTERLAYWLVRSAWHREASSVRDLITSSAAMRETTKVAFKALNEVIRVLRRQPLERRATEGLPGNVVDLPVQDGASGEFSTDRESTKKTRAV
jgi:glycosyltransferase involved in cell wall biosynthesis